MVHECVNVTHCSKISLDSMHGTKRVRSILKLTERGSTVEDQE